MNDAAKVAFVQTQAVCALAEIEAMRADNMQRQALGESMAWGFDDFIAVRDRYLIGHNAVIDFFA